MGVKLGSLLLGAGVITEDQLEEALQAQIMFGGRLGTNLLELGLISEETLARELGKQFNIPYCAGEDLHNIPEKILYLIPKDLIVKYQAVPVRQTGKQLWVAMIDPGNLSAVDEIAFVTNLKVHPMIAPETQVVEALEKYYKILPDTRYVKLSENKKEGAAKITHATMDFFEPDARPVTAPPPLAAQPKPETPPAPPPLLTPKVYRPMDPNEADSLFPLHDIADVLTEARSKEDIFQAIISPFMEFFERYALFINKNDLVVGHDASGENFSKEKIEAISIPLKVPSIFRDVSETKMPYFGPFPDGHNNQKIAALLSRTAPDDLCFLCPIPLVQKVGVILYADRCKNPEAVGMRLNKFEQLMNKAGLAFQVLVLKQKILHL